MFKWVVLVTLECYVAVIIYRACRHPNIMVVGLTGVFTVFWLGLHVLLALAALVWKVGWLG